MPIIKNIDALSRPNSKLRKDALAILEAGLRAIDTKNILRQKISLHDNSFCVSTEHAKIRGMGFQCNFFERIFFIGIGKCALDGALAIEEMLGDKLTDGIVVDVRTGNLKKIKSYVGTHPYPSDINIDTTNRIIEMVEGVTERDLVLVLISGGGSALLCMPSDKNCDSLSRITKELTNKGAQISELNIVRKHLSLVHGGGLAKILYPAQVVSLIFSDVPGDDMSIVASGPTVKDDSTLEEVKNVLGKYNVDSDFIKTLNFTETSKEDKYFKKVQNFLVLSNKDALMAMQEKAQELGFRASVETNTLSGEAREIGKKFASDAISPDTCYIFGGETTVSLKAEGKGGRNQELVLGALPYIKDDRVVASIASDGWDNTESAGALADREMQKKAEELGLHPEDFLEKNNSYDFWQKIDGDIYTGRLGSNVSDLVIILNRNGKR